MFSRLRQLPEKYYSLWLWLVDIKHKAKILPVDFKQSWTRLLLRQKKYLVLALSCEAFIQAFYALYPLIIGFIIQSEQFAYFLYFTIIWVGMILLEYVSHYFSTLVEVQSINSIQYNAFKFFLTVDPLFHTMKSSGKIFAKIERCARAYEDFVDYVLWDILPIAVSITAVVITFLLTDRTLGLVALGLLAFIAFINVFLNLFTSLAFERKIIEADDSVKALNVESLTQVQLIRSSFATNEIAHLAKGRSKEMMQREGTAWLAFSASISLSRLFYLLSVFILGGLILSFIGKGYMTILGGTTLLLTYINGTYEIIQIGRRLRKLFKSITHIKDLYSYIHGFGKQSFPVLNTHACKAVLPESDVLSLQAEDLHFDYNPKAKIFEDHNLLLEVPINQKNKLYGIIGPSGMGKTTLLSLLGGQLRPDSGAIRINGVSIYDVDDCVRRTLVAIQGQIASNLSGTVKRNLLLGIPHKESPYSDEDIIKVLKEVGIWGIFEEKEGLDTPIGESGLTISGGQRQRLNFAALYLRADYFRPAVILIDEPTSSLDEVSERAITTMIGQLAERALTLVIAHRLKTLEDAVGILDFSLLDEEKAITFYSRTDLEKRSIYYKKLIQGDITIDT